MRTVRTRNNGNRFIEQYEWTIGMCITVQIGELASLWTCRLANVANKELSYVCITMLLSTLLYLPFIFKSYLEELYQTLSHACCQIIVQFFCVSRRYDEKRETTAKTWSKIYTFITMFNLGLTSSIKCWNIFIPTRTRLDITVTLLFVISFRKCD